MCLLLKEQFTEQKHNCDPFLTIPQAQVWAGAGAGMGASVNFVNLQATLYI